MFVIPTYLQKSSKIIPRMSELAEEPWIVFGDSRTDGQCGIGWGSLLNGKKSYAMETGFFWDAAHIDSHGLYMHSAFNTHDGVKEYKQFNSPKSSIDIISDSGLVSSKYRQADYDVDWDGVVLALQNPGDRSVLSCGSAEDYYKFVEGACQYYKNRLFLKAHPWNIGDVFERIKSYSDKHNCRIEKCNHSVLKHCEFVILYNSTFCVDCFVRGVPVAQFAPGYFYQTGAVHYTKGDYHVSLNKDCVELGKQLADFIIWKYCFNIRMPKDMWLDMIKTLERSQDLFPLPLDLSYAATIGTGGIS